MKTKNLFLLPTLLAVLNLLPAGRMTAQTFTGLYGFTATHTNSSGVYTNDDGADPQAGLILSGNTLFGTAAYGGSMGYGTVFAVNTDGTGFTNLHSFTYSDGIVPYAELILSGNTLYGTAFYGGSSQNGTVFAVNTDGTGFTNLHSFTATSYPNYPYTNSEGANPYAGLILSGNTLYGTAFYGGSSGRGTVFAINTDGTGFTNLHSFTGDGANPQAGLVLSGNTLYGTASTVFAINTDGTGFTNLNVDAGPGGLILSGNTLYGTGGGGSGAVFAVNTNGTALTILHGFTETICGVNSCGFNSDGAYPLGLVLYGKTLCGTTAGGGSDGGGTVFAVSTNGTGFRNLLDIPAANPSNGGLILSGNAVYGNTVYGTTGSDGHWRYGTVFSLSFPRPQLTITPSRTNVILSWPTNYAGFDYTGYTLQSAPALTGIFTNLPASTNPYTNPITGPQKFYRLKQ